VEADMQNISDPTESLEGTLTMAVSLVSAMSKHFERMAVEMADISYDEFERGTGLVGELVEARTLDRIVEVETEYLQSVHRAFTRHASRLGDLYVAIGAEFTEPIAGARPGEFA
jgi:hypothetical protein